MATGDGERLRITAYDASGAEVEFRVRVVTLGDGRLGCAAPGDLMGLVEQNTRVRLDEVGAMTAAVVRSGRAFAEVHGRLLAARRLPRRTQLGPVLLMRPE